MELFGFSLDPTDWDKAQLYAFISLVGQLLGILNIPSVLLRRAKRPMAQLAWILCLVTLPFLGVILWWLMGRTHLERKRRRRKRARRQVAASLQQLSDEPSAPEDALKREVLHVPDNEVFPTTSDNRVRLLVGGREAFAEFEAAISAARRHVHVMFYIWKKDHVGQRLRDLLVKKASEGVEVRFLYDAFGASGVTAGGFLKPLQEAGGQVAPFLPFRLERSLRVNFRNHRKILICDGEVGFTGGLNVGDEYERWYDVAVRLEGPVVNQLHEVFAEDWYFAAKEDIGAHRYFRAAAPTSPPDPGDCEGVMARVMASGPDSYRSISHAMFFVAITTAQERIWITNPYFVPDQAIMVALRTASMRGVDVRLLLPAKSDVWITKHAGRGYYEELLQAGVRIFEYQPSVLHAKTLVFDRRWTIIGSANMDNRSFHLQFEVNLVCGGVSFNERLAEEFLRRLEDSVEIDHESWASRSTLQRLGEAGARLFSPVL